MVHIPFCGFAAIEMLEATLYEFGLRLGIIGY
jgi:hypothetical protein